MKNSIAVARAAARRRSSPRHLAGSVKGSILFEFISIGNFLERC